jgi:putative ATPase
MKDLGYAKDYKYAHSYEGNFVDLEFLPDVLKGTKFYDPGSNKHEDAIRARLAALWEKYKY